MYCENKKTVHCTVQKVDQGAVIDDTLKGDISIIKLKTVISQLHHGFLDVSQKNQRLLCLLQRLLMQR